MATSTNTTLGEIRLAGDLAGSNDGLNPQLTSTGVTAGSYSIPSITVDAKGRITAASETSSASVAALVPDATTTQKGLIQVGSNLNISNGVLSVPVAGIAQYGVVKIASGTGLSISNGTLSFDQSSVQTATSSTKGVVQGGSGVTITNGVISTTAIPDASTSVKGVVQIGTGIDVSAGTISIPKATSSVYGIVRPGYGLRISSTGYLEADPTALATPTTAGLVKLGSNLTNVNGAISATYNIASAGALGLVKVGAGLSIDGSGVLSNSLASNPPKASTTTLGLVQVGSNINVDANGVISVPSATTATAGVVRIGTVGLTVTNGVVNAVLADANTFGVVKSADINDLAITAGVMTLGPNIPKKTTANTYTKAQVSQLYDWGTKSGTFAIDLSQSNVHNVTVGGNLNFSAPSNIVAGGTYHIILKQNATGGYSVTFDNTYFASTGMVLVDSRPNYITIISAIAISSTKLAITAIDGYNGA